MTWCWLITRNPGDYAASLLSIAQEAGCHAATPALLAFSMARPNRLRQPPRFHPRCHAAPPHPRASGTSGRRWGRWRCWRSTSRCACVWSAVEPTPCRLPLLLLLPLPPAPAATPTPASLPYPSGAFQVRVVNEQGQPIREARVLPDNCVCQRDSAPWWCDPATGEKASWEYPGFPCGADGEATVPYPIFLLRHQSRTPPTAKVNYHVRADGYCEEDWEVGSRRGRVECERWPEARPLPSARPRPGARCCRSPGRSSATRTPISSGWTGGTHPMKRRSFLSVLSRRALTT